MRKLHDRLRDGVNLQRSRRHTAANRKRSGGQGGRGRSVGRLSTAISSVRWRVRLAFVRSHFSGGGVHWQHGADHSESRYQGKSRYGRQRNLYLPDLLLGQGDQGRGTEALLRADKYGGDLRAAQRGGAFMLHSDLSPV